MTRTRRFYPHVSDGEGQFIAVMRRRGDALCKNEPTAKQKCKKGGAQRPDKQEVEAIAAAKEFIDENLVKGSVDMWFLLWAMVLVCFGAIMSYSASAVYAEQKFDSSTYFLWRYVLFAVMAVVATTPFVAFARPWFWRVFGAGSYIASIFLLLLVRL